MRIFGYWVWDPNPYLVDFTLPLLDRPLLWYGFLFAVGFAVGYGVLLYLLRRCLRERPEILPSPSCLECTGKNRATVTAERLSFYVMIGAVAGARLGDLFFYQGWREVIRHPLSVIALWEGGLASHGGAIGILCALLLFSRRYALSFWRVLDFVVIPTALAAVCIRVGNFFNQEILGVPTQLPWGILFRHPADGGALVPRHPAQLYEAGLYLLIFIGLLIDWRRRPVFERPGRTAGLFLVLVFGGRFLIEFFKVEQSVYLQGSWLTMGQWLSLPFILLGGWLLYRTRSHTGH